MISYNTNDYFLNTVILFYDYKIKIKVILLILAIENMQKTKIFTFETPLVIEICFLILLL